MLQNALAPSLSQAEAIFVFLYKDVIDSKNEKKKWILSLAYCTIFHSWNVLFSLSSM